MKVQEILQEGKTPEVGRFVKFLYNHPKAKQFDWSDPADVEDLFDYAYADDCDPENIGMAFAEKKKKVDLVKAEREALSKVNFMIDNMGDKKQWKKILTPFAIEWSKKVAPEILGWIDFYTED